MMKYRSSKLGLVKIPAWIAKGTALEIDLEDDPFSHPENPSTNHLYYLEPVVDSREVTMRTRVFDNFQFREKLKNSFNINWNDFLEMELLFEQTNASRKQGVVEMLFSIGRGVERDYYKLIIGDQNKYEYSLFNQRFSNLKGMNTSPVIGTSGSKSQIVGSALTKYPDYISAETYVYKKGNSFNSRMKFKQAYKRDDLLGHIQTFETNEEVLDFFQSKYLLVMNAYNKQNGRQKLASREINRFSFLDGQSFTDRFFPIVYGQGQHKKPGIYIDHSDISENLVYVLKPIGNRLVKEVRASLAIPKGCVTRNPVKLGEEKDSYFSFLCEKNGKWQLRYESM